MSQGRTVTAPYPYTVYPLNDGNWMVASQYGLFVYDPDQDVKVADLSGSDHRSIAPLAP